MKDPDSELQPVPLRFQLSGRLRNIGKLRHWYTAIAEASVVTGPICLSLLIDLELSLPRHLKEREATNAW
jgi:hypothetical protein